MLKWERSSYKWPTKIWALTTAKLAFRLKSSFYCKRHIWCPCIVILDACRLVDPLLLLLLIDEIFISAKKDLKKVIDINFCILFIVHRLYIFISSVKCEHFKKIYGHFMWNYVYYEYEEYINKCKRTNFLKV